MLVASVIMPTAYILVNCTLGSEEKIINEVAKQHTLPLGQLAQPIRVAITGGTVSPPLDLTLYLLGQECTCLRLENAINWIEQHNKSL